MSNKEESTPSTPKKTKADEEVKSETPKASVKKDKKEKKTTKPKSEKKTKTTTKKTEKKSKTTKKAKTTTKKEATKKVKKTTKSEQSLDSKSDLSGFERYVFEAIFSKSTEDKPMIGMNSISAYIKQYIPDVKPGLVPKYARNAANRLVSRKILKNKNDSYGIASNGKKINISIPKRETVRAPTVKGEKSGLRDEKTEKYYTVTNSGRVSVKDIYV